MYREHFGFIEEPFGLTPNPRFFYENPSYREAYATLDGGIRGRRGLLTLIGAVGTGKTTVLRHLMANSEPGVRCVLADYPPSSFDELLTYTCRELGVQALEPRGRLDWITALKDALLARHARNETTALLLDEAQHLTEETLEAVRLLSNLETAGDKLLQIVLAGQPELRAKLDQASLAPLKQRITSECRLHRLSNEEIAAYIGYRLSVAGYRGPELFGPDAVEAIGFYSSGIPRLINVVCGNALAKAHRASQRTVSSNLVVETARALRIGPAFEYRPSRPIGSDGSAPSETIPDPIWRDLPSIPAHGELAPRPAAASPRPARRRPRRRWTRRWLWGSLGCLACVLAGVGSLAFLRPHDSAMATHDGRSIPVPAAAPAAGSQAERVGSPDSTGAAPDQAIPLRTELPGATAGSGEDAAGRAPAPPLSRQPIESVILRRGATISGIAWSAFGPQMFLALDLLQELNPHIHNLNWVLAGQQLRLPRLDRDDLVRAQRDGSYRLILNSLPNPAEARALSESVRARGYGVVITPRQVSDDLALSRVEISGLGDEAAAHRAWETALAAAWLPRRTPVAESASHLRL